MSARRLARQGLLLAEHQQPIASTSSLPPCPACRRSSSTTLAFAGAARDTHSKQRSSSWAAISRAGQAIFSPAQAAPVPRSTNATPAELEGAAAELVAEVKLDKPNPHRAWALFQQVDLEGKIHTIPLISLHALLPAIHLPPSTPTQRHDELHVSEATAAARAYEAKVELIRLRIRQAGGNTSQGDLKAMIEQYRELAYAPGASRVWDEMMQLGYLPTPPTCERVFSTLLRWIDLHERVGGKKVGKVTAQPLVRKAVAMLEDLKGDSYRTPVVLDPFFEIVLRAKDAQVFFVAMKAVYGFDVNYPGAEVDVTPAVRATQRTMTEKEVCWVLEMLSETPDMSRMMAVFEVFDNPSPRPHDASFFERSFTSSSSPAHSVDDVSSVPHPIGTRAFSFMVQTAGRLGKGHLVRHYFEQLRERWAYDTDARVTRIENVVGIERAATLAAKEDGSPDLEPTRIPTRLSRPLGMPATSPERPWAVPSTLVRDVMKSAKTNYDYPTARFIRSRTASLLKVMGDQAERISAVLDKLEPSNNAGSVPSDLPPLSLTLLSHEIDLINFHRLQLRSMYPIIKADSNIVAAYSYYRHRQSGLSQRLRRFTSILNTGPSGARRVLALRPLIKRREKQVLLAKILIVKQRLARLHKLGRAVKGRVEFDHWYAELQSLRARAEDRGAKRTDEAKVEGDEVFAGQEAGQGAERA